MGKLFVLYSLIEQVRKFDGSIDEKQIWVISNEAEQEWNTILEGYSTDAGWKMDGLSYTLHAEGVSPWLIIALQKQLPISGYLLSLRRNFADFQLASYALDQKEGEPPPTGIIVISSMGALACLVDACPVFPSALEAIKSSVRVDRWFYIADPIPPEWVREHSRENKQLFMEAQNKKPNE
jgi:hypothetical protein